MYWSKSYKSHEIEDLLEKSPIYTPATSIAKQECCIITLSHPLLQINHAQPQRTVTHTWHKCVWETLKQKQMCLCAGTVLQSTAQHNIVKQFENAPSSHMWSIYSAHMLPYNT